MGWPVSRDVAGENRGRRTFGRGKDLIRRSSSARESRGGE